MFNTVSPPYFTLTPTLRHLFLKPLAARFLPDRLPPYLRISTYLIGQSSFVHLGISPNPTIQHSSSIIHHHTLHPTSHIPSHPVEKAVLRQCVSSMQPFQWTPVPRTLLPYIPQPRGASIICATSPTSFLFLHNLLLTFYGLISTCLQVVTRKSRWRPWLRKAFPFHFMVSHSTRNGSF